MNKCIYLSIFVCKIENEMILLFLIFKMKKAHRRSPISFKSSQKFQAE